MSADLVPSVLEHLSKLYSVTDSDTKRQTSKWLETFQKKTEAWQVADILINSEAANLETRLFAAQTFRQKILYDLRELDSSAQISLRDSLLQLLWKSASGNKAIRTQLCLALADLAAQFQQWTTVFQDVVEFAKVPEATSCMLEFLTVLPEELSNRRLPLTDKEAEERSLQLLETNADQVIKLLIMCIQSSGNNAEIQESALRCLNSWLRTGFVDMQVLGTTPLIEFAFDGLAHDDLFDVCTDVVCEIIFETRDVDEFKALIEKLYPRFSPMLQQLAQAKQEEDPDRVRNFGRMFVEAGEAYVYLIAKHPDAFHTLLEGILAVAAYEDLDVAKMTFKFWYDLTNTLTTEHYQASVPQFHPYFDQLVDIILQHLHYPPDIAQWTAAESDDFRDFRHDMGDTLKDCCRILTPQKCLLKPMVLLSQRLQPNAAASWQQIEAPIFSLRSMGSEVPADENEIMPQIMECLSQLPDHPKIRYAATLVISRYSFWTREHPNFIVYQLNFISAGFQNDEVAAASALALKHLCKDCSELMVDYIGQLHPFYVNVVKTLPFVDALEVTEAISHVLAVLPVTGLSDALRSFFMPLAEELHALVNKGKLAITKEERERAGDLLEHLSAVFDIVCPDIPAQQPHPCVEFIKELWPVLTSCLSNFGDDTTVSEPLCHCFKRFISSYKLHLAPLLPQLLESIVLGFDATMKSEYLWVAGKIVRQYAEDSSEAAAICFQLVERLSQSLFPKLTLQKLDAIPDVVLEYFIMVTNLLESSPTSLIQSDLLSSVFQAGLAGLSMEHPDALTALVQFYRRLLGVALSVDELVTAGPTPVFGQNGTCIVALLHQFGPNFVNLLLEGMLHNYPWDVIPDVATIVKCLTQILPDYGTQWLLESLNSYPDVTPGARNEFLEAYIP
ncbi:ARM repeat-containing protein [Hesseltinella vesiculosa]|uniref:ARM repeat-containing protein n=1 Tax=Hesseltinella vesiculosa TaxID=101127 RepID=A0A1X2GSQ4_9FUNG|nr:ARM repeat-containing protein [Hesseltinella vesiculosa]